MYENLFLAFYLILFVEATHYRKKKQGYKFSYYSKPQLLIYN